MRALGIRILQKIREEETGIMLSDLLTAMAVYGMPGPLLKRQVLTELEGLKEAGHVIMLNGLIFPK